VQAREGVALGEKSGGFFMLRPKHARGYQGELYNEHMKLAKESKAAELAFGPAGFPEESEKFCTVGWPNRHRLDLHSHVPPLLTS
jgi:hypothetical protein